MRLGGARGREMVQGQGRQPNAGGSDRAWGSGGGARVSVAGGGADDQRNAVGLELEKWKRERKIFYVGPTCQSEGGTFMWDPLVSRREGILCGAPLFSWGEREEEMRAFRRGPGVLPAMNTSPVCSLHFTILYYKLFDFFS